jgi:Tfp pilus assembly protein PilF
MGHPYRLAISFAAIVTAFVTLAVFGAGCATNEDVKDQSKAEFHYKLANNYFYDHQIPYALRELMTCLEMNEDHPDAHHLMGFIFFGRKEHLRAERHFRRALEIRSGFHTARANLGSLYLDMKRWQEAITTIQPLVNVTLYPTPWTAHNNLGLAHHGLGARTQAMHHYKQSIFHNPKFCLGYYNLGRLYRDLGKDDEAIDHLERAATKCPKFADPHFELGQIYESRGQMRPARKEYAACHKDAPESPVGRRCKRRM